MKLPIQFWLIVAAFTFWMDPLTARADLAPGSMDVHWNEGAANCSTDTTPPLQVHQYNPQTFILREKLCDTFEAPFMYLLIGSKKALLIDTGDIADANRAPLAKTVLELLPGAGSAKLPLLAVHSHRHLDHRAGDAQFANVSNVQVVGFDLESVKSFYKFSAWPNGDTEIDLGERTVDAIPTPGHSETEVSFYDRNTGLFFSGDFLMNARLLVQNSSDYLASAERAADFVKDRPVTYVLGGHIEMNSSGELFPWQSQFHPSEHVLQMAKADLLALPAASRGFNGFYSRTGNLVLINSIHILIAAAVGIVIAFGLLIWWLVRYLCRRKRGKEEGISS